jgi:four helix bundle protein
MADYENVIEEKSFEFAVRIVNLAKYIRRKDKEYVLTKQLLRCGTSIGANVSEAQRAQSKADFYAKMSIALKEANETYYWLRLLHRTEYISQKEFESMKCDADELIRILVAICKTVSESRK